MLGNGNPDFPLSEDSFESNAELLENASESGPPELRISLTNTTGEQITIEFGPTFPFYTTELTANDGTGSLFLYHPDMGPMTAPDEPIDGCWQVEDPDKARLSNLELKAARLQPDDTVSETYTLTTIRTTTRAFPMARTPSRAAGNSSWTTGYGWRWSFASRSRTTASSGSAPTAPSFRYRHRNDRRLARPFLVFAVRSRAVVNGTEYVDTVPSIVIVDKIISRPIFRDT